jgi:parvulin-like peptidyl-prolyl isomerase
VTLLSVVFLLSACGPQTSDEATSTAPELAAGDVASFGDFRLDRETLDQFIVERLAEERPVPGTDLESWYRERISDYMIEAQLLKLARDEGLDQSPVFIARRASARSQIETELCLNYQTKQLPPITRADLEAEYQRNLDNLNKPERRLVLHLYRRAGDEASRAAAEVELDGLRDRILQGDDFARLARAHSDSESRHRGGELGWLFRGELPEAFDNIVFGLDEGVPSRPLATADGVHLLFAQTVSPARDVSLIEALPVLREQILLQQVEARIKPLVESDTRDFAMPDQATLLALLQSGDADALLLQDADYRLTVGAFRRHLAQLSDQQSRQNAARPAHPYSVLQALRTREKLRRVCEQEGWLADAQLTAAVTRWEREQLVSAQRRQELRDLAGSDEARLRLYHSQNPDQFSTPVSWNLRRLRIALDAQAGTTMVVLEKAAQNNSASIEDLQATLGGVIDSLSSQRMSDLSQIAPKLPALIAPLQPGELSAPMRTLEHLEIYQLVSVEEPVTKRFEEAREQAITNFVRQHAAALYQRYVAQAFAAQPLFIDPDALAQLVEADLPQPDISPERLSELLEAL